MLVNTFYISFVLFLNLIRVKLNLSYTAVQCPSVAIWQHRFSTNEYIQKKF